MSSDGGVVESYVRHVRGRCRRCQRAAARSFCSEVALPDVLLHLDLFDSSSTSRRRLAEPLNGTFTL